MDIRLTAEYVPSSDLRPDLPVWRRPAGYVELFAHAGDQRQTLVVVDAVHLPGAQPGAEEEVILESLSAFFIRLETHLERD